MLITLIDGTTFIVAEGTRILFNMTMITFMVDKRTGQLEMHPFRAVKSIEAI